jgi:hypothetical protein
MRATSDIERKLTATPSTQWIYSSVSKPSLQKTGVFLDSAGDFRKFLPKKCERRSPETFDDKKSPYLAGLSRREKEILSKQEWLAGDVVQIAPVSTQIPCKQGILQGILHFWGPETVSRVKKPLCCRHFLSNSLTI